MAYLSISILPVKEAFRYGLFQMARKGTGDIGYSTGGWDSVLCNQIMTAAAVLIFFLCLGNLYRSLPAIFKACFNPKVSMNINDSLKLRNSRNITALSLLLPYSLFLSILDPDIEPISGISREWRSLAFLGIPLAYLLLRKLFLLFFNIWKPDKKAAFVNGNVSIYNSFVIAALVSITATALMLLTNIDKHTILQVFLSVTAAFLFVFLIVDFQIFHRFIKGFSSFLYLCALEILPLLIFVLWIW